MVKTWTIENAIKIAIPSQEKQYLFSKYHKSVKKKINLSELEAISYVLTNNFSYTCLAFVFNLEKDIYLRS